MLLYIENYIILFRTAVVQLQREKEDVEGTVALKEQHISSWQAKHAELKVYSIPLLLYPFIHGYYCRLYWSPVQRS